MQATLKYLLISSCVVLPLVTTLQDSYQLNETVGQYQLCIPFHYNLAAAEMVIVQVSYLDIDAKAGEDYMGKVISYPSSAQNSCFDIVIIDDSCYELVEAFVITLKTPDQSKNLTIYIIDDDILEVSWTSPAFTVPEGDGSVQVCATLTCTTLSPVLLGLRVTLVGNSTAVEGIDYYKSTGLDLLDEMNCYNIEIITDIEYESNKEFVVYLTSNRTERIYIKAITAKVIIVNYYPNIQFQSQPTVCGSLESITSNSITPDNVDCTVSDCVQIQCESAEEILTLTPSLCDTISLTVTVTNKDDGSLDLDETLSPTPLPYVLNYTISTVEFLNISIQLQTNNVTDDILVSLNSSSGLELPLTAIPVICPDTSPNIVPGYIAAAAAVGSTVILLTTAVSILFILSRSEKVKAKITH